MGIIIVFIVYIVLSFANSFTTAFSGREIPGTGLISGMIAASMILYLIGIIIPFALKNTHVVGIILLIIGFSTLISSGLYGVVGLGLFIAAGITSLRWRGRATIQTRVEKDNPLDILMERYAKGEITKDQFDEMKKRLDELEK